MIRSLTLSQFRNIEHAEIELHPGVQLIVGPNAHGKTSLLEAVALLATSKVLRGSRDSEAISHGFDSCHVQAELAETRTTLRMDLARNKRKRASINGVDLRRAADLLGRLPCVIFSNEDLWIVRGEPSHRRSFLDTTLCQLFPSYLGHLANYKRALDQRNALLKLAAEQRVAEENFEPWEQELDLHGSHVRRMRVEFLRELSGVAPTLHATMAEGEGLRLCYQVRDEVTVPGTLADAYRAARRAELRRGSTLVGPHRDEVLLDVNGAEARLYGSQGQQRTAALAIKLGTLKVMEATLGVAPVLLLDDVMSELDLGRRERLLKTALHHTGQVILTCTEPELVGRELQDQARIFNVHSGRIQCEK